MSDEIKEKLNKVIESELDELIESDIEPDKYKFKVDVITKLIDKQIEIDKLEMEVDKHSLAERMEHNKVEREREANKCNEKNQFITNMITIGSILVPVFVTVWGTYKTLKFEETGTVTTIMGRGFINKLIPKK